MSCVFNWKVSLIVKESSLKGLSSLELAFVHKEGLSYQKKP